MPEERYQPKTPASVTSAKAEALERMEEIVKERLTVGPVSGTCDARLEPM